MPESPTLHLLLHKVPRSVSKVERLCKGVPSLSCFVIFFLFADFDAAAGFGMLILAPLPPEQQFGVIMCLTILYAFLTSIFILPPVIMKWAEWRKRKKGYIISPVKQSKNEKDDI